MFLLMLSCYFKVLLTFGRELENVVVFGFVFFPLNILLSMGLRLISSGTVRKRGILLLDLLTSLLLTQDITESYLLPLAAWLWASNSHQQ